MKSKEEYERDLEIIDNLEDVEADGDITMHGRFVNAVCDMYDLVDEIFEKQGRGDDGDGQDKDT